MEWIPTSKEMPPLGEKNFSEVVLITLELSNGKRIVKEDIAGKEGWVEFNEPKYGKVVAWTPYPKPYMGDY